MSLGGVLGFGGERLARAVSEHLERRVPSVTRVLVGGWDMGRALAKKGVPVFVVEPAPRPRPKVALPQVAAASQALPFADGSFDAALLAGLPDPALPSLREWARVVRTGGLVVLAATATALLRKVAPPDELAALLIHAHLVDVEQQRLGATWLTTARVERW